MKICVFGAACNKIDKSYILAAEKLGERMAERGHTLVFGAGAHGMMGATARGAYSKNGEIIGVIPSFFRDDMTVTSAVKSVSFTIWFNKNNATDKMCGFFFRQIIF